LEGELRPPVPLEPLPQPGSLEGDFLPGDFFPGDFLPKEVACSPEVNCCAKVSVGDAGNVEMYS